MDFFPKTVSSIKQLCNLVFSAGEDAGAVPMRTTPFPDIIRLTPAPGMYPSLTPSPGGEEIKRGEVDIFAPLPIPPSVTDVYAAMAPTGKLFYVLDQ